MNFFLIKKWFFCIIIFFQWFLGYSQNSITSNQQAIVIYSITDELNIEKLFQNIYAKTILIEFDEPLSQIATFELLDVDGKLGQEKVLLDKFKVISKLDENLFEVKSIYKGGNYEFGINRDESFVYLSSRTFYFFSAKNGGNVSMSQQFYF